MSKIYYNEELFNFVVISQGGQSILSIVDFYGATLVAFTLAITELYTFCYMYGVGRFCRDIEFMLGRIPNIFWRICWWTITPGLMTVIVVYTLWNFEKPKEGDVDIPDIAHYIGWCLTAVGLIQVPIFAVYTVYNQNEIIFVEVKLVLNNF